MKYNTLELLKELCNSNGVSGFERETALLIAEKIKDACNSLYISKVGNLVAFKKGKKTPPANIMYCAHMDEVGMMIRHINDDGTLLFEQTGIMPYVLPSKRVAVGKKRIPGVICSKPVHLLKDGGERISEKHMYIDIGAKSKEEAENLGVYTDYAAFENNFTVFGDGNMICSKALDDRIGCAVMIQMINSDLEYDSHFVFTVGEELGGAGAVEAARLVKPDIAIVFESTTASDIPSNKGADRVCSPGSGAVMPFMDGGTLYDRDLHAKIGEIARRHGVKIQTKSKIAGGTDAAYLQRSIDGVRVCAVSLACRYIHTACCVASVKDVESYEALAKLIDKNMSELI